MSRHGKECTMRSDTQNVMIAATPEQVFAFVADGANLPRWAIGFAKSVRNAPSGWIVGTAQGGEVPTTIAADSARSTSA
jgi:uncharacterized protein YndB with AHSA1/START domain